MFISILIVNQLCFSEYINNMHCTAPISLFFILTLWHSEIKIILFFQHAHGDLNRYVAIFNLLICCHFVHAQVRLYGH